MRQEHVANGLAFRQQQWLRCPVCQEERRDYATMGQAMGGSVSAPPELDTAFIAKCRDDNFETCPCCGKLAPHPTDGEYLQRAETWRKENGV